VFQLSTKTHYGVAALIDLANVYGQNLLRIKEIVENRQISKSYLEQIFNRLSKFGVVKSVRGNRGGYELSKDPRDVTLFEIVEILEGPLDISSEKSIDVLNAVFTKLEDDIRKRFSMSLYEIAEEEKKLSGSLMYYI
jgi:Rrf2 family protein